MSDDDPELPGFETAAAILAAQPFSVLIGARLTQFGDGRARIEVPFEPNLLQQNGFMHGGVIAYAIDNATSFAGGSVLGMSLLSSGITASFHRPARGPIVAEATVITSTRSSAAVRCEVSAVDVRTGKTVIVASGTGTISKVSPPAGS